MNGDARRPGPGQPVQDKPFNFSLTMTEFAMFIALIRGETSVNPAKLAELTAEINKASAAGDAVRQELDQQGP